MKAKLITLIVTLAMSFSLASAQDFVFRVLANKGENSINKDSSWEPLKTGSTIQSEDKIKVGSDSYVGLYHSTGRTVELKEAGEYTTEDLLKTINTAGTSVAGKYADFVLSKMQAGEGSGHRMSVTGAVERATDDASLKVLMPSSVELFNEEAFVRWSEVEGQHNYKVILKNMFDEVIMESRTSKPSIMIDFEDPKLAGEKLVIFSVKLADDENVQSAEYGIKKLSADEKKKLEESYQALKLEVGDDSALDKLIYAAFFEDNNLMIDALTNYEYAIEMAPGVDDFKNAYEQFLVRNGLGN